MANVDGPNGFKPAYHLTGGTIRMSEYLIADDYNTNIFTGDLVIMTTDGTIIVGAASTPALGVFAGCSFTDDAGVVVFKRYWPADQSVTGSYATAYVYDDPQIVYRAQMSGASTIATVLGSFADVLPTGGSTNTGQSAMEVDSTDLTDPLLRVVGFPDNGENDTEGTNAEVYVVIAEHQYAPSALGVDLNT